MSEPDKCLFSAAGDDAAVAIAVRLTDVVAVETIDEVALATELRTAFFFGELTATRSELRVGRAGVVWPVMLC